MPNVLSDLIWVQTDCVNVISRRTVARKLNASCAVMCSEQKYDN